MWPAIISGIASLAGGAMQADAAKKAGNMSASAAQAAADAQYKMYMDAILRAEPYRKSGLNALNFQNAWLGLPAVNDNAINALAYGNSTGGIGTGAPGPSSGPVAAKKAMLPSISGAITNSDHSPSVYGRYVEGAKNGESEGQFALNGGASVSGALISGGTNRVAHAFGLKGPSEVLGRALGFQKHATDNYDEWGTPQANAGNANAFDYAGYVDANPDVATWATNLETADPRGYSIALKSYDLDGDGKLSKGELGQFHYDQFGKSEGRAINTPEQAVAAASPATGAATGDASTTGATPDLWTAITNNPLYKSATEGFLGINGLGGDVQNIQGKFATGGKLLSGAQQKALQDRSTARSYGALSDIYNQYAGISGTGATTTSQLNALGESTAQGASQATQNAGNARASGYLAANKAYGAGINGAIGALNDYGKSDLGWAA